MSADSALRRGLCFISYARADQRFALRFADDLRARGVAPWVDQLDIRASQRWDRAIERAIHACRSMVVILSPRAVGSDNVADEITLAIESGKTIIPVMIEQCRLPLRLARMHMIDATSGYEVALAHCLEAVKSASAVSIGSSAETRLSEDVRLLEDTRRQLAAILGPIAGILIDRAADRAASVGDLYGMLSLHIDDQEDRERFVSLAPKSVTAAVPLPESDRSIAPADIRRLTGILTRYLGPIAPLVTRRESHGAKSLKDLLDRVARTIRSEQERADFCREARVS